MIEAQLRLALACLTSFPSLALVSEARGELAAEELQHLSSGEREIWASLKNPVRRLEWSEARRCEALLRERLGAGAVTSISHTRHDGRPVVFAVGASGVRGIGVDVEISSRAITEGAALKFVRPEEAAFNLTPLEIWVIKEAVFKANPENAGTVISDYRILSLNPGTPEKSGIAQTGISEFHFRLLERDGWIACCAIS